MKFCCPVAEWKATGDNLDISVSSTDVDKWTGVGISPDQLMVGEYVDANVKNLSREQITIRYDTRITIVRMLPFTKVL